MSPTQERQKNAQDTALRPFTNTRPHKKSSFLSFGISLAYYDSQDYTLNINAYFAIGLLRCD